jgi:YgiT-type zinc finger domain-containing protein
MEIQFQRAQEMKCFICLQAETIHGLTSVLLERGQMALTVTDVPARVCPNCGEAYADATVTAHLLHQAERLAREGMKVETLKYDEWHDPLPATDIFPKEMNP